MWKVYQKWTILVITFYYCTVFCDVLQFIDVIEKTTQIVSHFCVSNSFKRGQICDFQ